MGAHFKISASKRNEENKMKRGSRFNFRRLYPYVCEGCGKRRGTRIYSRRVAGICSLCREGKEVNKDQMSLLDKLKYKVTFR